MPDEVEVENRYLNVKSSQLKKIKIPLNNIFLALLETGQNVKQTKQSLLLLQDTAQEHPFLLTDSCQIPTF